MMKRFVVIDLACLETVKGKKGFGLKALGVSLQKAMSKPTKCTKNNIYLARDPGPTGIRRTKRRSGKRLARTNNSLVVDTTCKWIMANHVWVS